MKAGSRLDAIVAKEVMGWTYTDEGPHDFRWTDANGGCYDLPNYSTDIAAAWEVIDKLTAEKYIAFHIVCRPKSADAGVAWSAGNRYSVEVIYGGQGAYPGPSIYSNSLPHAICMVALKAVGHRVKE